jgi:hypothetical protein
MFKIDEFTGTEEDFVTRGRGTTAETMQLKEALERSARSDGERGFEIKNLREAERTKFRQKVATVAKDHGFNYRTRITTSGSLVIWGTFKEEEEEEETSTIRVAEFVEPSENEPTPAVRRSRGRTTRK